MTDWRVPGFTSTGSKRPEALFGAAADEGVPSRLVRAAGARVWDETGREYLDLVMALGAVGLGYGHPAVRQAASAAIAAGTVGPLPPVEEERLAEAIARRIPWMERIRFLKTGAEAVAAAVRIARVFTGREMVLACGYHGWLDWCQGRTEGVPQGTRAVFAEMPFNDADRAREMIRYRGKDLAAVVIEPLVVAEPSREWLETLRVETRDVGAALVFDEIKTAFRLAVGGAAERYGVTPDLAVIGKAFANGFPLAAVGGSAEVMAAVNRTWISSTLATESVALAAALATLAVYEAEPVCAHLHRVGTRFLHGLHRLQREYRHVATSVGGVAEMCFLHFANDELSSRVAAACARRGLLFKRTAYNFVSYAHTEDDVDHALSMLSEALKSVV